MAARPEQPPLSHADLITQVSASSPAISVRPGAARPVRRKVASSSNSSAPSRQTNNSTSKKHVPTSRTSPALSSSPPSNRINKPYPSSAAPTAANAYADTEKEKPSSSSSLPDTTTTTITPTTGPAASSSISSDTKKHLVQYTTASTTTPNAPRNISTAANNSHKKGTTQTTASPTSSSGHHTNTSSRSHRSRPKWISSFIDVFLPCASSSSSPFKESVTDSPSAADKTRIVQTGPSVNVTPSLSKDPITGKTVTATSSSSSSPDSPSSSELIANASGSAGKILRRDETADVLSGAVVPPGADGSRRSRKASKLTSPDYDESSSSSAVLGVGNTSIASTPSGAILAPSSSSSSSGNAIITQEPDSSEDDFLQHDDFHDGDLEDEEDEEERIIAQGGMGIPIGLDGKPRPLLDEIRPDDKGRKCLVLDLDETLVHSTFKIDQQVISQANYIVPVEIENQTHNVYVIKRPGVDSFLKKMGELYEIVVFTASLAKYADPVLDHLDMHGVVRHRLFRESCWNHKGNYVKDLSQLGRPLSDVLILDNSPASYMFHPHNAVPVSTWFSDTHDTELLDLQQFLEDLAQCDDVRGILHSGLGTMPIKTASASINFEQ